MAARISPTSPLRTLRSRWLIALLSTAALTSAPALAQDDDDDVDFGDLDEGEDDKGKDDKEDDKRTDAPDDSTAPPETDPEDEEWTVAPDAGEGELDLDADDLEKDSAVNVTGPGQDNARLYREQLEKVENYGPDEESLAWERYLKKYPESGFRRRIEERIEELAVEMYDDHIEDRFSHTEDAGKAELQFAQPQHLDSIDPRDKIRVGFEWGFPDHLGFVADMEKALRRDLSVHGGLHRRYLGRNIEAGARYALIKSARTQMLLTGTLDVHMNLDPVAPGLRPQVGFGKRFSFADDYHLDLMVQAGSDLLYVNSSGGGRELSPRIIGGYNVTFIAGPIVRFYIESSTYMKGMFDEEVPRSFRFNVNSLGIRFTRRKGVDTEQFTGGVGASVPYTSSYWAYHFGSVNGDMNYYY